MKSSDRLVAIIAPALALVAAFWFLAVSPKRAEVGELDEKISQLQTQVSEQEQLAEFAGVARKQFPNSYRKLVSLGEAVPSDSDTSSLIVDLQSLADKSNTDFISLLLNDAVAAAPEAAPPPPPPPAEGEGGDSGDSGDSGSGSESSGDAQPAAAPGVVPATEADAATLPIGAQIGPAGLPVMPYELKFVGDFNQIADFLRRVDNLVDTKKTSVDVSGRLITVNSFTLARDPGEGFPSLSANFSITTYVAPDNEGATAGATPTGPSVAATPTATTGSTP